MTVKRSLGGSKAEAAAAYYELYQENGKIKVSYRQMLPGASVVAASASRVTVEVGLPTGEIVRHDLARMGEGWQVLRSATREGSSDWRPSTG
jgi:hypothetical protein